MTQARLTEFGAVETDEDSEELPPASELVKGCRTYQYRQEKYHASVTDNEKAGALRRARYAYHGVSAPLEPIHHRDGRVSKTEVMARRHHREVMERHYGDPSPFSGEGPKIEDRHPSPDGQDPDRETIKQDIQEVKA